MAEKAGEYLYDRALRQGRLKELEERLSSMRNALQEQLKRRFGSLPEAVQERIAATTSFDRLLQAVVNVSDMKTLDDLTL